MTHEALKDSFAGTVEMPEILEHGYPSPIVPVPVRHELKGVSVYLSTGRQVLCAYTYVHTAYSHLETENRLLAKLAEERLRELLTHLPLNTQAT